MPFSYLMIKQKICILLKQWDYLKILISFLFMHKNHKENLSSQGCSHSKADQSWWSWLLGHIVSIKCGSEELYTNKSEACEQSPEKNVMKAPRAHVIIYSDLTPIPLYIKTGKLYLRGNSWVECEQKIQILGFCQMVNFPATLDFRQ